jgi:hypothetical protein
LGKRSAQISEYLNKFTPNTWVFCDLFLSKHECTKLILCPKTLRVTFTINFNVN